jgi:predicted nucleotidyltransferase
MQFDFELEFIGSFATGLWTSFSDIDIAFVSPEYSSYIPFVEVIEVIFSKIKALNAHQRMILLNENLKFPAIKLELNP